MTEEAFGRIKEDLRKQVIAYLTPLLDKQNAVQSTVFFTGGKADAQALLDSVDGVLGAGAGVVVSDSFLKIADPKFISAIDDRLLKDYGSMQKYIAGSELIIVPIFTRNSLAKVAVGIQDNLVTCGLAAALMRGIPVIAIRENCAPHSNLFKTLGLDKNPAYNNFLREREARLASFGVKFVDQGEFASALSDFLYKIGISTSSENPDGNAASLTKEEIHRIVVKLEDSFITCEDILRITPGSTLEIPRRSVVTPLALEYVGRNNISLKRI